MEQRGAGCVYILVDGMVVGVVLTGDGCLER